MRIFFFNHFVRVNDLKIMLVHWEFSSDLNSIAAKLANKNSDAPAIREIAPIISSTSNT